MLSYRRYIVYNNETFYEGNYKEVAEKTGISISSIRAYCDTGHAIKGWKIAKSFDVVIQLLDAETGEVIMEGNGHQISRKLHACDNYVSNLIRHPSSMYQARRVHRPTEKYFEIARRFGREVC